MLKHNNIIFDLDGVLWDTINSCLKSLEHVKNKYADITKDISAYEVKSAMGKPMEEIKKIYYGYIEDEKATKYAKEAFEYNVQNLLINGGDLYPNLRETIIELSTNNDLFIVSNCIDGYIQSFLKTSNLEKYFQDFESNGKTKLSKGENIELIIKRNNLKENIYYVGDTMGDKEAADYAKVPFVYASYGFGNVEEYDYKLNKIEDILKIFNT